LGATEIEKIANIQIKGLSDRLAEQELSLSISTEALALIAKVGFDPIFGARPLKRAIQQGIENPLAQRLLAGDFVHGSTIHVTEKDGELVFK
jgi:ATP-dependent Clp protease ATP-binding subunit ClpB